MNFLHIRLFKNNRDGLPQNKWENCTRNKYVYEIGIIILLLIAVKGSFISS